MTLKETQLLLVAIMKDLRGAFPTSDDSRLDSLLSLCDELGESGLSSETRAWIDKGDYLDGRFFRDCDNNYNVMMSKYGLEGSDFLMKDKSSDFKSAVYYNIMSPEFVFDDYEEE